MILMRVDFPAPFSPTSACTSPAWSVKDTPFSACTPAKDFRIEEAVSRGGRLITAIPSQKLEARSEK
jgi:hypothetical protein